MKVIKACQGPGGPRWDSGARDRDWLVQEARDLYLQRETKKENFNPGRQYTVRSREEKRVIMVSLQAFFPLDSAHIYLHT